MAQDAATPPANVYRANGQLSVAVPLPGAHREHVRIVVRPDSIRVDADCKYPQAEQHYLRHEWKVGSWELELPLPERVDPARARATLNYGVLMVMAPMSSEAAGEAQPAVE